MNTNSFFSVIEEYAEKENVPIMKKDSIDYLLEFIRKNNIKDVLEIGSAIGYSALKISTTGANVTTIERDEERYKIAVENINKSNYKNKINIILSDALDVNISEKYDLIFIDAAKGKNKEFIDKFKKNLKTNGFIIIDNMDFHGLVGKSSEIKKRRLRSLVRKIESFIEYMEDQTEFKVSKINVGDGLYLLERNN
ncbi:MAG: O-methyltransferase [Tenericutes bacterium]|nr:O-methyltransferase [Mycoplasmatota bacterium]